MRHLIARLGLIATEIGELCATDRITFAQASTGAGCGAAAALTSMLGSNSSVMLLSPWVLVEVISLMPAIRFVWPMHQPVHSII